MASALCKRVIENVFLIKWSAQLISSGCNTNHNLGIGLRLSFDTEMHDPFPIAVEWSEGVG